MANTYTLLATATAGSSTSSFDFTSISSAYTDLLIKVSARTTVAGQIRDYFLIRFNSSGSGYSRIWTFGYDSSTASSGSASSESYGFLGTANAPDSTGSTFNNAEIYIPNYASSNKKSYSVESATENNSTTTWMLNFTAGFWDNTSAITSITLLPANNNISAPSGNWAQYSTAYLYGINKS